MINENAQLSPLCDMPEVEAARSHGYRIRTADSELVNIAMERKLLAENINGLENAIKANPEDVSEKHKRLWNEQLAAMECYYNVLGDRIRDFVDQTQRGTATPK